MPTIPVCTDRDDWMRYQARRRMVSPDLISDATLAAAARAYRHVMGMLPPDRRYPFHTYLRRHGLIQERPDA